MKHFQMHLTLLSDVIIEEGGGSFNHYSEIFVGVIQFLEGPDAILLISGKHVPVTAL